MKKLSRFLFSALVLSLVVVLTSSAMAQRGGQGGGRGGPPGGGRGGPPGGGGGGDIFGLIFNEQIQKEAEILPDQVSDIREIMDGMRQKMGEIFSGMRDMSQEERESAREGLFEKMREARADIEAEVNAVLMPHQLTRIKQIALQQQLNRGGGGGGALTRGPVAEALGLTEVQIEALEAKRREIEEGLREKVAKLQKEAQNELISTLTAKQQAILKDLIGESFEMQRQEGGDRGGRGPGGGDRGARTPRNNEL
ncbi:MAG: hypothetical protein COA78_06370 [Blastopirellula sp.]|nr:MAG: hypothetical protein COA78_06370 [Blastopirellula sp.]